MGLAVVTSGPRFKRASWDAQGWQALEEQMTLDQNWNRVRLVLAAAVAVLMGACGGQASEPTGASGGSVTGAYTLLVSTSSSRGSPVALSGADLNGSAYIFTSDSTGTANPSGIASVSYWLDNTAMNGAATHVEKVTPYDFVGTADDASAEAWLSSSVANGTHTITQAVTPTSGPVQTLTATFTVGPVSTYTLLVSTSPTRGSPSSLSGANLSGSAYIFTGDASKSASPAGISQVSYWLDNKAMTGIATHVEKVTPYDFVGTASDGTAEAWLTSSVSSGTHTLTQAVVPISGATQTLTATFTVGSGSGGTPDAGSGTDAGSGSGGAAPCPSTATLLSSFGSAGTGGDDTSVFQNAINTTAKEGSVLRISAGSKSYNISPITFPSNANVCLDSGVTVEANPGYGEDDVMLTVDGASNVQILGYGATFHMNTSEWSSDPDPEYRHCIEVVGGSSNVTIGGFSCVTFGGDGVYLGGNSSNVTVEDITADGCARDGLTVISAKNSTIKRCHFINGHTGVDMEPNTATDAISGVTLEDSFTTNNNWGGVNVSIYAYDSSTPPLNVTVARHTDENTGKGVTSFDGATSFSANGANGVAINTSGTLLFDTCTSINAGSRAAWVAWWTSNGPSVTYKNLTVTDPNVNGTTAVDNAAVAVGRGGGGAGDQGNVFFTGTNVSATNGNIDYYFTFYDGSGFPFQNVQWVNPGTLSGAKLAPPNGLFNGNGVNSVDQ
jgi:hypothetical protein